MHPKIVSELLGHASAAFTMDTYGHVLRGMQTQVVAKLQTWLSEDKSVSVATEEPGLAASE